VDDLQNRQRMESLLAKEIRQGIKKPGDPISAWRPARWLSRQQSA
jgi:hypothetical protein